MTIPIQIPPPPDSPIGWSPNSLGTTAAQVVSGIQAFTEAEMDAFLLAGASLVQRSLLMTNVVARSLNSAPQTVVDFTTLNLAATKVVTPVWWCVENLTGATGYSATISLNCRYVGLATDLFSGLTVSNLANNRNRQTESSGVAGDTLGSNVFGANRSIQVRAAADRTLGSGFVRVTLGFIVMDELP